LGVGFITESVFMTNSSGRIRDTNAILPASNDDVPYQPSGSFHLRHRCLQRVRFKSRDLILMHLTRLCFQKSGKFENQ
jgi:hypothetical protein